MSLYLLINLGMSVSVILFSAGYLVRKKNIFLHKLLNSCGIFFNLLTSLYLLATKYLSGGIDNAGIMAVVPDYIVLIHRMIALLTLILMLIMGFTGMTGKKILHKKIYPVFMILYLVVYISGIMIFKNKTTPLPAAVRDKTENFDYE